MNKDIVAYKAETAIILGSGLGAVSDAVKIEKRIPYHDMPGFPLSSISGHLSELLLGTLSGKRVLVLQGRSHTYETGNPAVMRPIIQMLSDTQVPRLIITNAAGSLNPEVRPGRLMMITDHINMTGLNPLIGERGDRGFVSMTNAYDPQMASEFRKVAKAEAIPLAEGVYSWYIGPSFETPAEIRAARILGASAVGMSTVPEVILARSFGLRVAVLSAITNLAAGMEGSSPSHEETKRVGTKCAQVMAQLLNVYFKGESDD